MKATILSVAYPFAPVGVMAVGGAEQVLTLLEAELVHLGYKSVVIARDGSAPAGKLLATTVPDGVITEEMREQVTRAHQANIDRALATEAVDLVHMHGIDFHRYNLPAGIPVLVTLHLPPSWYPDEIWELPANFRLQCVSETQRAACPAGRRARLEVVENGVVLPPADKLPKRRNYALMLSRICPEKNLHEGLEAARLAGVPVLLAGEAFPYEEHLRYLREQIEPRLGDRARLLGAVVGAEKTRLLARARCLLLPTLAPETSSVVAMEALAVGTPVVAYRSGAIPEIVDHGRTGFLVDDVAGMAGAIERVDEIDHAACRDAAATRFPLSRMVEGYVRLYSTLMEEAPRREAVAAAGAVEAGDSADVEELTVSVVGTVEEVEALVPEWTSLWRADAQATPFQSPEWLMPWWKHVGEGELFCLAVRDGERRLVGWLPMYVYVQPGNGERHLLLVGAGTSDYLDGVFAARGYADRVAAAALGVLRRTAGCWDRAMLHQLRGSSPLLRAAREFGDAIFASEPCSLVPVRGWAALPGRIRLNSGRYRRRAEARGRLEYRAASTVAEAQGGFAELLALHAKRWQDEGVLKPLAVQEHHREAIPKLFEAGLLWMLSLKLDGRTVAVLYALVDSAPRAAATGRERRLYSYLIGFDPEFGDLSPGTLLLSFAFDRCEAEGVRWLDMLRGGEAYKRLWGATEEPTYGFELACGKEPADTDRLEAISSGPVGGR